MAGKKRGNGEGSIEQRPNGTYRARYTDGTGTQRSVSGKTREEAHRRMVEAQHSINNNTFVAPAALTFAEWLDLWLEQYVKISREASTYSNYVYCVYSNIKPFFKRCRLQDVTPQLVQAFINGMNGSGLSSATVRKNYAVLRAALNQAHELELIAKMPCAHSHLPKAEQREIKVLTLEEQERFVRLLPDTSDGHALCFMLGTGMRIGEVLALQWDDIGTSAIHVRRAVKERMKESGQGVEQYVGDPKSKNSNRFIPLNAQLSTLLKEHRRAQSVQRLQCGAAWSDNNLVFPNSLGGYLDDRNIANRVLTPTLKAAKIAHCSGVKHR